MVRPVLDDASRSDVFRGLGHPIRRQVLEMLRKQPSTVGDLGAHLKISIPALSNHLAILRETGLVTDKTQGPRRVYTLRKAGLKKAKAYLAGIV